MKFRFLIGGLLLVATFGARPYAQTNTASEKRWVVVNITDPVMVGRQILMGKYLIVHDDAKMAKGEPCTTIYRFDPKSGPKEQVVAFMCLPKRTAAPDTVTLSVSTDPVLGLHALRAYEFAGDGESHGVPADAR